MAWKLLADRHLNFAGFELPGQADTPLMVAKCEHVLVLDFANNLGAQNALTSRPFATSLNAAAIDKAPSFDTPI